MCNQLLGLAAPPIIPLLCMGLFSTFLFVGGGSGTDQTRMQKMSDLADLYPGFAAVPAWKTSTPASSRARSMPRMTLPFSGVSG